MPAGVVGVMPTQKGTSPAIAADILGTQKEGTLSLQSGTCQAGVNSCQIGVWSAPLPRARAAERAPRTYPSPAYYKCGNIRRCAPRDCNFPSG